MNKNLSLVFLLLVFVLQSCKDEKIVQYETVEVEQKTMSTKKEIATSELIEDISNYSICNDVSYICMSQIRMMSEKIDLLKSRVNSDERYLQFKELDSFVKTKLKAMETKILEDEASRREHYAFKGLLEIKECDIFSMSCNFDKDNEDNDGRALYAVHNIDKLLESFDQSIYLDDNITYEGQTISRKDLENLKNEIFIFYKELGKSEIRELEEYAGEQLNSKQKRVGITFYSPSIVRRGKGAPKNEVELFRDRRNILKFVSKDYIDELKVFLDKNEIDVDSITLTRLKTIEVSGKTIVINPVIKVSDIDEIYAYTKKIKYEVNRDVTLNRTAFNYNEYSGGGYDVVLYKDMLKKFVGFRWYQLVDEIRKLSPETKRVLQVNFHVNYPYLSVGTSGVDVGINDRVDAQDYLDRISEVIKFNERVKDFKSFVDTTIRSEVSQKFPSANVVFPNNLRFQMGHKESLNFHDWESVLSEFESDKDILSNIIISILNRVKEQRYRKITKVTFRDYMETDRTVHVRNGEVIIPLMGMDVKDLLEPYIVIIDGDKR